MSRLVAATIVLSAATYLFDFFSNLAVAFEYARPYARFIRLKKQHKCDYYCHNLASEATFYFYIIMGLLIAAHTLNAIIFRFKFKKEDGPYRSAYFLPLIHLWRLVNLVRRTWKLQGAENLRNPHMNSLFTILGTSIEGVPIMTVQFVGYIVLSRDQILHHMSLLFKVSIVASLLSTAYNGGSSVESIASNAKAVQVALSSGLFTMFASIARSLTYTNIVIRLGDYFDRNRPVSSKPKFYASDTIVFIFVAALFSVHLVFYWLHKKLTSKRAFFTCFVLAYMSITTGPLYPMVSEATESGELGEPIFQVKLFGVALVSMLVDLVMALVPYILGTLPTSYFVASHLAFLGYLLSLAWYIRVCEPDQGPESFQDQT